jgi:hypothetical protein
MVFLFRISESWLAVTTPVNSTQNPVVCSSLCSLGISSEVLDEHDVRAPAVLLAVKDGSAVGRDRERQAAVADILF